MANRDKPCGFIPIGMLDGSDIPEYKFPIYSSQADGVYVGDVMKALASGNVEAANASDADAVLGVCVGIQDTNGNPIGSPNSSVSTKYLPATTGGYAIIALALPGAKFRCQLDSGTTPTSADLFASADHVATAGDTTTARSRHELDSSGITTARAQCKIIGLFDEPGNSWGEHADVVVVFAESYWFGAVAESGSATRGGI